MVGCWERRAHNFTFRESWSPIDNGVMYGSGAKIFRGSVSSSELTNIFVRHDSLIYVANPSGQEPAEFSTAEARGTKVTFSNPGHDFPQRVIYGKAGAMLFARIEGKENGRAHAIDYSYNRVSCGEPAAIERTIRGLDSLWARNYETHDTVAARKLMGDDFVMTGGNGKQKTRADEMRDIKASPDIRMHYFRTREVTVKAAAHIADVAGIAEWSFDWKGKTNTTVMRYTAKYRRGGPLGWRIVDLRMLRMPE